MSRVISIRVEDQLEKELTHNAKLLHISKNLYIRKAIELLNQELNKQKINNQLKQASARVREDSLKINHEFDGLIDDGI